MNCENCKKEFQPTKTNGTIQKYCSLQCRNQAANTRRIDKIIATHNGKIEQPQNTSTQEIENQQINRSGISGNGYNNQELVLIQIPYSNYLIKYYKIIEKHCF